MDNIELQVWGSERKTRWKELLPAWYNFWTNEPLNSASVNLEEGNNKENIGYFLRGFLSSEELSLIVAWDTVNQQAAGFLISFAKHCKSVYPEAARVEMENAGYPTDKYTFAPPEAASKINAIGDFLIMLSSAVDVFQQFGVDKVWMIEIATVSAEYTRRGIANRMTEKVLQIAKEKGFQLAMSEATSAYVQRLLLNKFQFEKVFELPFENNYTNYCQLSDELKKTHQTAAVLAKRL